VAQSERGALDVQEIFAVAAVEDGDDTALVPLDAASIEAPRESEGISL